MWISSLWIPSVQHLSWVCITWQDFFGYCSIATLPCFKSSNSQVNTTLGRPQKLVWRTFHIFISSQVRWFAVNEQDWDCSDIERDRKASEVLKLANWSQKSNFVQTFAVSFSDSAWNSQKAISCKLNTVRKEHSILANKNCISHRIRIMHAQRVH